MQASEFNNLNNYNLEIREEAAKAVHSILNPTSEQIREIKKRGGKDISKMQREVMAREINQRTDKLDNKVKEIKLVKKSIAGYEKTLASLNAQIGQLEIQAARGEPHVILKLEEMHNQRNEVTKYLKGMQKHLAETKEEWEKVNAGLTHLKHAVNNEDVRLLGVTAKLDKMQALFAAQFQGIKDEKA